MCRLLGSPLEGKAWCLPGRSRRSRLFGFEGGGISSSQTRRALSLETLPDKLPVTYSTQRHALHAEWRTGLRPRNVLLLKKPGSQRATTALRRTLDWLLSESRHPILEPQVVQELELDPSQVYFSSAKNHAQAQREYARTVDMVITLGGDGTLLHASSLFQSEVPPTLSFSLGSLGFLVPFGCASMEETLGRVLVHESRRLPVLFRMRLAAAWTKIDPSTGQSTTSSPYYHALNEVLVHRGREAHLSTLDVYSGDSLLTDAVADGLIVSTPTGSTAYSLSAGGPIVHPLVETVLLTPICPQSLSFRTVLLPADLDLRLQVSQRSRGHADFSVDGRHLSKLDRGDYVLIKKSPFPVPIVSDLKEGGADWIKNLNAVLKWNQSFSIKS